MSDGLLARLLSAIRGFGRADDDREDSRAPQSARREWDPDADLRDRTEDELDDSPAEAVEVLEITDTLDLHTFAPRDVKQVVLDWLDEVSARGFSEVRIIHGRGKGVQRNIVRAVLERDPRVEHFGDAPDRSGWGATVARLRPE